MQVRALVVALIAGLNGLVEELEKALASDGDEGEQEEKPKRRSRTKSEDAEEEQEEEEEEKPRRRSRSSKNKDDEEGDAEEDDKEEKEEGDGPSEDDIIDAVRAAQKVLEKEDVVAIIRKYGKCDRASQVPEDRRQKVIDALEKAIDDAK